MTTEDPGTAIERSDAETDVQSEEGPRQTVRRMAADEDAEVGPFFPSAMSAPEAALAGATADMSDEAVARLRGEEVQSEEPGTDVEPTEEEQPA